jgi:hypothetical protein
MKSLRITERTTLLDLRNLNVGSHEKLRVGIDRDTGECVIYVKGPKSDPKLQGLDGNSRRSNVAAAITRILEQTPAADKLLSGHKAAVQQGLGTVGGKTLDVLLRLAAEPLHLAAIQAALPKGVSVDKDGTISGSVQLTHSRDDDWNAIALEAAFQSCVDRHIRTGTTKPINVGNKVVAVGGAFLTDAVRMPFYIDGKKTNIYVVSSNAAPAMREIASNLSTFAGSDEAVRVLSAACHQGLFARFATALSNSQGEPVMLLQPHKSPHCHYHDAGGRAQDIGTPAQLQAETRLGKYDNGDFKMEVNWDYYFSRIRTYDSRGLQVMLDLMPKAPTNVVKRNITFEMRIFKANAEHGQFAFQFEKPPVATLEGKVVDSAPGEA